MKTVLFILLLIRASIAVSITCRNSLNTETLTFKPSEDPHTLGQYKVEFCREAHSNVTEWNLVLRYNENYTSKECKNSRNHLRRFGPTHTNTAIEVQNNLTCTQVCFSTFLERVLTNTCYKIQTYLKFKNPMDPNSHQSQSSTPVDRFYYITNNVTKENITPIGYSSFYAGGVVIVKFQLGNMTVSNYRVTIIDNVTHEEFETSCNVSGQFHSVVECQAVLPPGQCYKALLLSPFNIYHMFCTWNPSTPVASSSPMGEWPTAVGIAALMLLAVALCCVVRRRYITAWQRRVRESWLKITSNEPTKSPNMEGNILLLYARDCMQFRCAAEKLGALVQRATGCQVIDVYSGASVRLWASGGDEWLRLMLERDNTRVLLLQSPAGALLAAELAETRAGPALSAPLLGSLVWWRRPHAGDALLALALRQLAAAPPSAPYRKHYVANISGLGTDMAPSVTPFRRYTLPATVVSLLRDLAPSLKLATSLDLEPGLDKTPDLVLEPVLKLEQSDLEPLLQQFKEAADAFTDHVRDHPDYLADELLFK